MTVCIANQSTEVNIFIECNAKYTTIMAMKQLDLRARSQILHLFCEGNSIRSVSRLSDASKNTLIKLLIDAGKACMAFHDANVRDVNAKRVQVDEIWPFTYAKQKNVAGRRLPRTARAIPGRGRRSMPTPR